MPAETEKIELEIVHVLCTDIVGYSKLLTEQQQALIGRLNQIVRDSEEFRKAEAGGRIIKIPTGDGMALVFYQTPTQPVECALEISRALQQHPELKLRMGVHSGPVSGVVDVSGRANVAGAGINMAQRVMDCGDAWHILLSRRVAEDLEQYAQWQPRLHDLGECEVKHGVRLQVVNLYTDELGNPEISSRLKAAKSASRRTRRAWLAASFLAAALIAGGILFLARSATREKSTAGVPLLRAKSIAVLPFENRSAEPENAFFADGVQDEILTNLARIADLKVISRTSVMRYISYRPSSRLARRKRSSGRPRLIWRHSTFTAGRSHFSSRQTSARRVTQTCGRPLNFWMKRSSVIPRSSTLTACSPMRTKPFME